MTGPEVAALLAPIRSRNATASTYDDWHQVGRDGRVTLAAVEAVLKLHAPGRSQKSYDMDLRCGAHPPERGWLTAVMSCPDCSYREYSHCVHGCEGEWPCFTVRAIVEKLVQRETP